MQVVGKNKAAYALHKRSGYQLWRLINCGEVIAEAGYCNGYKKKYASNQAYEKFMACFHQFCPFMLNLL